jgi:hypothetical protein
MAEPASALRGPATSARRPRRRLSLLAVGLMLALGPGATSAAAQSTACQQDVTPTYTDACGPTFVLPSWGDAGGWTQPEQYETIQLADVDGDGDDELLARTPAGVAVHDFDKTFGQWRPQVTPVTTSQGGTSEVPVILTAFATPPPLTTAQPNPPATDWTLPQYYDTIQAADIDGKKGEEIIGRSGGGLIVFKFTPGASPGQGSWQQLPSSNVFAGSGWDTNPSMYATIQTGDLDGDGAAEVLGRESDGIVAVRWTGSPGNPWVILPKLDFLGDDDGGQNPAYYTSLHTANIDGDPRQEVIGRDNSGIFGYKLRSGRWTPVNRFYQPFSDHLEQPDCPFTFGGTDTTCFGSGPGYYATVQFAELDGNGRQELVGRASDGLRGLRYQGETPDAWGRLATLTDLSDANGYNQEQYWETIQFADINGDGRDEALARDKNGLNAWSYNPGSKTWSKLAPTTPLALADDPWGDVSTPDAQAKSRSYYSTIQTGDVDGDGKADVVARGPYGIRTWFYNRRGTGGWERYLTEGYPNFPTAGQTAAFDELNKQAQGSIPGGGSNVRGVWLGENPPSQSDLTNLQGLVTRIGDCTNPGQGLPIQYASCTPPQGASGFTAADWTSVLNEIIAEIFWVQQVWDHFYDPASGLQEIWSLVLEEQLAQLPVIANDVQLAGPAQITTEYDASDLISTVLGLGASLVALFPPTEELEAPLWLASEIVSLLPSDSPNLLEEFQTTYANLQGQFADGIAEANKALAEHSELVRQDLPLLTLVGQLRFRGTWALDRDGMTAAGRQGFALWLYKTLLPTVWARFVISNCIDYGPNAASCYDPPNGPWVTGSSQNFTAIGPAPTPQSGFQQSTPCYSADPYGWQCQFLAPTLDMANVLWGKLPQNCAYDGQNANTVWTFTCPLGVDPTIMLTDPKTASASEAWSLPTYTGNPGFVVGAGLAGSASGIGDNAPAVASASASRAEGAVVRLRGSVALQRRVRLRRAKVVFDRLLFERGGAGELVRHRSGRRLPPLVLSRRGGASSGRAFASRRRGGPQVRLRLRPGGQRRLSFRLRARNVRLPRPPTACSGARPGVDLATWPIPLHTRLHIDDGRRRPLVISLRPQYVCRRDRLGNVGRLVIKPPTHRRPAGRSAAVGVRGPRRVAAGKRTTYSIRVRNRRRTTAYDVTIHALLPQGFRPWRVWRARVGGREVVWRLRALRPGRSRTVQLGVRVARSAAGTACQTIVVSAIDTRPAHMRACVRVRRPARPQASPARSVP